MPRKKSEGRADFILNSALSLFAKVGYSKSTMNDVANEAGIAVGTIYLYYKNKEDIVRACAKRFHAVHREFSTSVIQSSKAPDQKLKTYLLNRFDLWEKETAGSSPTTDLAHVMTTAAPEISAAEQSLWTKTIKNILAEGEEKKRYRFESLTKEAKIFIHCLIGFFPLPGQTHPFRPTRKDFTETIEWFDRKWRLL